jgi:hypothetical protein
MSLVISGGMGAWGHGMLGYGQVFYLPYPGIPQKFTNKLPGTIFLSFIFTTASLL